MFEDDKLGRPDTTLTEIQTAKDVLFQILVLFAETEKISKSYKPNGPNPQTEDDLSTLSTIYMDPAILSLNNKRKALVIKRRKEHRGALF